MGSLKSTEPQIAVVWMWLVQNGQQDYESTIQIQSIYYNDLNAGERSYIVSIAIILSPILKQELI